MKKLSFNLILFITFSCLAFLIGCTTSAGIKQVTPEKIRVVKLGTDARLVQLKKFVVKLNKGDVVGVIQAGLICAPQTNLVWQSGQLDISNDDFTNLFRNVLENANYQVVGDPDALFEDPSEWKTEYLIAGLVNDLDANFCYPLSDFGNWSSGRGEAYIQVEWRIYSRLDREVIHKVVTEGNYAVTKARVGGDYDSIFGAFEEASKNLLADDVFHNIITK